MNNIIKIGMCFCILFISCNSVNKGFNSIELTSSKGEHIYINSINYGVTGDHQLSIITKNKNKLKYKIDTVGTVSGLDPFYYSFRNDSLILFFNDTITYQAIEKFNTIDVAYKQVDNIEFMRISFESKNRTTYFSVPNKNSSAILSMPLPLQVKK